MILKERVAIVTGGARGIGKAIAVRFAQEGCSVAIADMLVVHGEKTRDEIREMGCKALFMPCDISSQVDVSKLVKTVIEEFGKIDILVNNAGIPGPIKPIADVDDDEWEKVVAINLKGPFICSKAVVPYMKEARYGKIINFSSLGATNPPAPSVPYSASKAGVIGLTLVNALELAPFNICVNVILPGAVRTEMWEGAVPPGVDEDAFFAEIGKTIAPMERLGTPEEIAGATLFLASDLSSYVTGQQMIVGGGAPLMARLKA